MKNRPWPLVFLALGQMLSPVTNIFFNAWIDHLPALTYLQNFIHHRSIWAIFNFLILDPISGLMILHMRLWVYPFFLALQLWTLTSNLYFWTTQYQGKVSLLVLLGVCFVNTLVVSYYLLPQVRVFFFNRRMRWWEAAPRYYAGVMGKIRRFGAGESAPQSCKIENISAGGLFILDGPDLRAGDPVQMEFEVIGNSLHLKGLVVHSGKSGVGSHGIQFTEYDSGQYATLKRVVRGLKVLGKGASRNHDPLLGSLSAWLKRLFTTGKGIVPEVNLNRGTQQKK